MGIHPELTDEDCRWATSGSIPQPPRPRWWCARTYQRQGLGTALLERMVEVARGRGVRTFAGEVLAENDRMLRILRRNGLELGKVEDSVVRVGGRHRRAPAGSESVQDRGALYLTDRGRRSGSAAQALVEPDDLRVGIAVVQAQDGHGVERLPPPVGGAAGVEEQEAVRVLDQRFVGVPEDDDVGVGEQPGHPLRPPGAWAGVVKHRDADAVQLQMDLVACTHERISPGSQFPIATCTGSKAAISSSNDVVHTSPAWRMRSASESCAITDAGRARQRNGAWVSYRTAMRTVWSAVSACRNCNPHH